MGCILSLALLSACVGSLVPPAQGVLVPEPIGRPVLPALITDRREQAEYLALRWWDKFPFGDTLYIDRPEVTEPHLVEWLGLLAALPPGVSATAIGRWLDRAACCGSMYDYLLSLAEKYLYDPNSPLRNEDEYLVVLEHVTASSGVDSLVKLRYRAQLDLALRNRPGEPAADFAWVDIRGRRGTLYGLKSEYTLLFFYNPGCGMCKEIRTTISRNSLIERLVRSGRLSVLALYPDEDLSEWRAYADSIPAAWINAFDPGTVLRDKAIYDLRAIPTLYLLDAAKRVLLKDCVSVLQVVETLAVHTDEPAGTR